MGLKDPKYNNQIKSFEKSQLISRIRNIFELSNHHKTNRMLETDASKLPMHHKKLKRLRSIDYLK
jgi:hypothetical protein